MNRKKVKTKTNVNLLGIYLAIILFISVPIINDFLFRGHDIYFHLMRIEGLAQGLKCGQLPVKIQPVWYDGFGYAVSVFYGDIFIYIAAFFRLAGFTLQNAYKGYLLCCNMATVLISGYSFGKIFNNKYIGVFGSCIYSLSAYRLVNLYTRGAAGEYTGMIFTPLIIYACVLLLNKEKDDRELNKGALILGVSMASIIQSHILTAELVCIVLCMVLVLFAKRVFNKKVILAGVKAVAITIGLSAWFIVPFLDYMLNYRFNINSIDRGELLIQRQGVLLSQIFAFFDNAVGESLDLSSGPQGDFAQGTGLVITMSVPVFVILVILFHKKLMQNKDTNKEIKREIVIAFAALVIGAAMIIMSSIYFPWDRICKLGAIFKYVVVNIQFPWRFTGIAAVVLTLLWCANMSILLKNTGKSKVLIAACAVSLIAVMSSFGFMADLFDRAQRIQVNSAEDMDSFVASGEEYIPLGTVLDELKQENLKTDEDVLIKDYYQKGTNINFYCENTSSENAEIELPLLFYEGYKARATDYNSKAHNLKAFVGENNVLRVVIPQEFMGEIEIYFGEPWYWRISEIISVCTLIGIFICIKRPKGLMYF